VETQRPITSVDLFCGAGGLTLGLARSGISAVLASDNWDPAGSTFQANFEDIPFLPADVGELTPQDLRAKAGLDQPPTLIVGGPPCQGFSSAGARRGQDRRNGLVAVFARLIAETMPAGFVFENVEGFLTMSEGDFVVDLLDPLIEAGYWIDMRKVNVANYGVPQLRKRVIAVGMLGCPPDFPAPTHRAWGAPGVHRVGVPDLPATPSFEEALADLPRASSESPGTPAGHFARRLNELDSARVAALLPGQTMRDLPPEFHHASYSRRANRRVADGMPTEKRGGAPAGLRRLRADEPSKAITSAAPREFIHPSEDRALTLRECARLQTFPDSFEFSGNFSEKATLIGNAVPPQFAEVIGRTVAAMLRDGQQPAKSAGRLVAFEATVAEGKSPALQLVTNRVLARYSLAPTLVAESD
jgi:DNA (cytosine-5)-methyltransferase 1